MRCIKIEHLKRSTLFGTEQNWLAIAEVSYLDGFKSNWEKKTRADAIQAEKLTEKNRNLFWEQIYISHLPNFLRHANHLYLFVLKNTCEKL